MSNRLEPKLRRKISSSLRKLSVTNTFTGRTTLLSGLPDIALNRNQENELLDLNLMIDQLIRVGRLKDNGIRPLVVIIENGMQYLDDWDGVLAETFDEILRELDEYYGGEIRIDETPSVELEALIFKGRDERVPYQFIERANLVSRSIGRVQVPRYVDGKLQSGGETFGTSWLIAPGILITNHHVIENRDRRYEQPAQPEDFQLQAENVVVWFDYVREAGSRVECSEATLLASKRNGLDYAIIRIKDITKIADRKPLLVEPELLKLQRGHRLNIVQHSGGGPLIYAIRSNFYVGPGAESSQIRYLTDTKPGASGSPVFTDNWKVIGLHYRSRKVPDELYATLPREIYKIHSEEQEEKEIVSYHNEGYGMWSIINDLEDELRSEIAAAQNW